MKKALITGITGQDGSYLADLLLEKGYEVHGIIRRASTFNTSRIDHLYADPHVNGVRMFLHYGDLSDSVNLVKLLYELKPDEIYHLGAQSHVRVSFDIPEYTSDVTGVATIRILEAIREAAFGHANLDWKEFVKHDPRYERPAEVDVLLGDASKAKKIVGWEPKVRFHELVRIMVDADMDLLSRKTPRDHLGKLP